MNSSGGLRRRSALLFEGFLAGIGRLVFLTFVVCLWEERAELRLVISFGSLPATDVPALVRCHFVDTEPRCLRLKPQEDKEIKNSCHDSVSAWCSGKFSATLQLTGNADPLAESDPLRTLSDSLKRQELKTWSARER